MTGDAQWDAFISHASEDKEDFVRPLVKALEAQGLRIWYDEVTLTVGDSLRRAIDKGLKNSRYAIVVLSPHFIAKGWTNIELDGLVARQVGGQKVILPVWHNITRDELMDYSPTLADKLGVSSAQGLDQVVGQLLRAMQQEQIAEIPFEREGHEPETILIPAGPFLMGSDDGDNNEAPQHEVDLPAYRIGKYPITNREYAEFIKRTRHEPPEKPNWLLREPPEGKLDHPVAGVSWLDAMAYCRWLSEETGLRRYRLPSEAEWEKAASWADGQKRLYPWGDEFNPSHCNSEETMLNDTTAVGSYSPQGDSFYGCADMIGNVQEWTSTLWGSSERENSFPYPYQMNDGREELEANHLHFVLRVYRGSSFRDNQSKARCTLRRSASHKGTSRWRGFRVVLEV